MKLFIFFPLIISVFTQNIEDYFESDDGNGDWGTFETTVTTLSTTSVSTTTMMTSTPEPLVTLPPTDRPSLGKVFSITNNFNIVNIYYLNFEEWRNRSHYCIQVFDSMHLRIRTNNLKIQANQVFVNSIIIETWEDKICVGSARFLRFCLLLSFSKSHWTSRTAHFKPATGRLQLKTLIKFET